LLYFYKNNITIFTFKIKTLKSEVMKLKKVFLISFAILLSINTFSQIRLGVRAGLTSSSLRSGDFTTPDGHFQVQTLSNVKVGFQGGLMLQITLFGAFIQPEFLLSSTGGEVVIRDLQAGGTSVVENQKFTKLDIPILVGTKMGPLRLGIGPVASIILNKPSDAIDFSATSIQNKYHKATFGYQLGAGLDIWKLAFDVKYEGNLSRLGNGVTIGSNNYNFDSRNRQWIFAVGLFF
jgi:hypothetical protein